MYEKYKLVANDNIHSNIITIRIITYKNNRNNNKIKYNNTAIIHTKKLN